MIKSNKNNFSCTVLSFISLTLVFFVSSIFATNLSNFCSNHRIVTHGEGYCSITPNDYYYQSSWHLPYSLLEGATI